MRIETPYFIMFLLVGTRMLAAEASDKSCYFGRENLIENKPQKNEPARFARQTHCVVLLRYSLIPIAGKATGNDLKLRFP